MKAVKAMMTGGSRLGIERACYTRKSGEKQGEDILKKDETE